MSSRNQDPYEKARIRQINAQTRTLNIFGFAVSLWMLLVIIPICLVVCVGVIFCAAISQTGRSTTRPPVNSYFYPTETSTK